MRSILFVAGLATVLFGSAATRSENPQAKVDPERIARIRAAKMPKITQPVMFNTPEADAILSALEIFPPDNAFNQLIDDWPLHPNSKNIVASIGADKPFRCMVTQPCIDTGLHAACVGDQFAVGFGQMADGSGNLIHRKTHNSKAALWNHGCGYFSRPSGQQTTFDCALEAFFISSDAHDPAFWKSLPHSCGNRTTNQPNADNDDTAFVKILSVRLHGGG